MVRTGGELDGPSVASAAAPRSIRLALTTLLLFGTLWQAACGGPPKAASVSYGAPGDVVDEYTYIPPDSYYDLPGGVSRVPSAPTQTTPNYAAPQQQQMDSNTRALMLMYGMQMMNQSMTPPQQVPRGPGFTCYHYGNMIQCQ